jgi:hypothetical protein
MDRVLLRLLVPSLLGLALLAGPARAQLSPGPLSEAHRAFDSPTQCFQCHPRGGNGVMSRRCLDCHREVAWMRSQGRGFHARDGKGDCTKCHPDHAGRDFPLVKWDEGSAERFDHARTGFVLKGKHADVACAKCHAPAHQRSGAVPLMKKKDHARSFLGLETTCLSCHKDPHRAQLGADCTKCHDERQFKPPLGFDHARSAFPLTGKHAPLACDKCHRMPQFATAVDDSGRVIPQWKPLPHADCTPCHKDPHAGRFQKACASCHRTDSFQTIDAKGFDHDKTRYPLRGRHAQVACSKCHDPKVGFGQKPRFETCKDCHKDAHAGAATLAGKPADCAACHTVAGFDTPAYTVAMHQQSPWPLAGRHATVPCASCHAKQAPGTEATYGPARVLIRPTRARCADCHRDPHDGRFAPGGPRARAQDCLACHTADAWRPSLFGVGTHGQARFALDGAHRATPCATCHAELKAPPAASSKRSEPGRPLTFAENKSDCIECHTDPHRGQFAKRKDKGACTGCHTTEHFAPAERFDHVRDASYRLEGAHLRTACSGCHRPEAVPGGGTMIRYKGTPTRCDACHAPGIAPLRNPSSHRLVRASRDAPLAARTGEVRHASRID